MSLSGLADHLGVTVGTSVGSAQFEFLPLPMVAGVALLGTAVSVSAWAVRASPEPYGKSGHLTQLVVTGGKNSGLSG